MGYLAERGFFVGGEDLVRGLFDDGALEEILVQSALRAVHVGAHHIERTAEGAAAVVLADVRRRLKHGGAPIWDSHFLILSAPATCLRKSGMASRSSAACPSESMMG